MRIFDTVEEAEAAVGRNLMSALSVDSLVEARATVIALLGEEYVSQYSVGETVIRVFVAVSRVGCGYTFYLVESGARFWENAVRLAR